ncbi:MAG: nuclear transport factor 2 family protein [Verrucomicrobia bacterium]|nr:nuclear transport factor 2 family protein [Verrucomicrobiota bacterium]
MKRRSVVSLVGLAISFALPTFAQQNAMVPDRQVIEQLGALGQKYKEAYANNDAAALAACYTWDAVIVTPQGPVYGRDAIENWYADQIERSHPKNHIDKVDPDSVRLIGTAGDAVWVNGELSETIQDPNGGHIEVKGYWSNIFVREGDTWKIRFDTYNVTAAPGATASPTASPGL